VSVVLQVRVCRELQTWILGFGEHAIVVRPASLAEVIGERLKNAAATYAKSAGARPSIAKAKRPAANPAAKRRVR
jgi:hypothetical protein